MKSLLPVALLAAIVTITVTNAAPPVGFTTFFNTATCPEGWGQLSDTQGRLIVSTAKGANNGVTVNAPLSNAQDVGHQHPYSTTVSLSSHGIAAASCCDHHGAQHGTYPIAGTSQSTGSGYPFTQQQLCTYYGASNVTDNSQLSYGTVGFFNPDINSCPSGWMEMSDAEGRVLVPGYEAGGAIRNAAQGLTSGEDRKHNHTYNVQIPIKDTSFEGAGSCCNDNNGNFEVVTAAGTTISSSSNLPYIQMLTCVNQKPSFNQTLPSGARTFSAVSCPPGYAVANDVSGRMLVSLPSGGSPGASFGGSSIPSPSGSGNFSPVSHKHMINGSLTLPSSAIMLVDGCCDNGYAAAGDYVYASLSDEGKVDLPFTMLPLCEYVGSSATTTGSAGASVKHTLDKALDIQGKK